ncbi:MAG: hypothetical protein JWO86_780 [Myxococcaceae bacterium]|nr:hypothetical protein [Myxococcaceae bacterium]
MLRIATEWLVSSNAMFVRSISIGASLAAVVLMPAACSSFSSDNAPAAGASEGGAADEAGSGAEGGVATTDGPATEGSRSTTPVELSSGYGNLRAITASETDVFFVDQANGGGVFSVPIIGGSRTVLSTSGAPSSIAVLGNYVYWTDPTTRTVVRMPVGGGTPNATTPEPGADPPPTIVVTATNEVVTLIGSNSAKAGRIDRYAVDLPPSPMAIISGITNPFSIAAFGSSFYWTEGGQGFVATVDVATASRKALFQEGDPEGIAADAAGVYWTVPSQGTIRGSLDGKSAITLASGQNVPRSIAGDGSYVYWTTLDNELRRAGHIDGGTSSVFASGFMAISEMHVRGVAVTSKYVVWLTADGKVLRLDSK